MLLLFSDEGKMFDIPATSATIFAQQAVVAAGRPGGVKSASDTSTVDPTGSPVGRQQALPALGMEPPLETLLATANRRLSQNTGGRLELRIERVPAGVVLRLVDTASGEVLRRYPMGQFLHGLTRGDRRAGTLLNVST